MLGEDGLEAEKVPAFFRHLQVEFESVRVALSVKLLERVEAV